jgi:hypothetical protein
MTLNRPKSPFSLKGTIVLVCYDRPNQLQVTIDQLKIAQDYDLFKTIVVQQLGNEEVSSIVRRSLPHAKVLQTGYNEKTSIRKKINANVYTGVTDAFRDPNCDFVIILEDDIAVATDFLWFMRFVIWKMYDDENFRAVNGFSKMKNKPFRKNFALGYVRLNFGVGWGWAIKRDTFLKLKEIWHGDEDNHWDGLIEDFMRTGFVVNPLISRILNVGLEGSGTHSGINEVLESEIADSFENHITETGYKPFHEKISLFEWREDCYNLSIIPFYIVKFQFIIWKIVSKLGLISVNRARSGNELSKGMTRLAYSRSSKLVKKLQKMILKRFLASSKLDS